MSFIDFDDENLYIHHLNRDKQILELKYGDDSNKVQLVDYRLSEDDSDLQLIVSIKKNDHCYWLVETFKVSEIVLCDDIMTNDYSYLTDEQLRQSDKFVTKISSETYFSFQKVVSSKDDK